VATVLALTDYQRAVIDRLPAMTGAADFDGMAAAAVEHDRRRPPEPRWREDRPSCGTGTAASADGPATAQAQSSPLLDLTLPAASGGAVALHRGDRLRIEQLEDGQGVDLRVSTPHGAGFSAARTRAAYGINPTVGAALRMATTPRSLLTIVQDSAPGHDLCFPACCELEYTEHAGLAGHLGCAELHAAARAAAGLDEPAGDAVLNLWLPSAVDPDGRVRSWPTACRRGDFITLRADAEVVVTLSCCPDDLFGTSQYEPKPVRVTVTGGSAVTPDGRTTFGWPSEPPASAIPRHELCVTLSAEDLAYVDRWAERGWLGLDRPAVTRALIFRLHESLRTA
jgi:uncharacterized protein YcgI (DUF1989 family)